MFIFAVDELSPSLLGKTKIVYFLFGIVIEIDGKINLNNLTWVTKPLAVHKYMFSTKSSGSPRCPTFQENPQGCTGSRKAIFGEKHAYREHQKKSHSYK
jgi:hypothetical protein